MDSFTQNAMELSRMILISDGISITGKMREKALSVLELGHSFCKSGDIVVNGFIIDREHHANIQHFVSIGKKIPAIKYLRELTHMGLREAKISVENPEWFTQPNKVIEYPRTVTNPRRAV